MGGRSLSVSTVLRDLRYAARGFRRSPGFAAAAILSLGIGIGATTAIFSVTSALLLRPLPYADADRLFILWNRSPGLGISEDWFSTAQYFDIKNGTTSFEQVALAIGANYNLTGDGAEPERVGTIRVTSNLLAMLGARAATGRLFVTADDDGGAAGVAVLGHGTWQRRYGGDSRIVGRTIVLNGLPYLVIGVLQERFDLPREVMPTLGVVEHAEILINLPLAADAVSIRTREDYNILAKTRAGVMAAEAQAELDTLTVRLRRDHPEVYPGNSGLTFSAVPLQEQVVGQVRRSLLVLVGAVALVLLTACANVAGLLVARAVGRQQEMAVRVSLGATGRRIAAQVMAESALLALAGGVAGLAIGLLGLEAIRALGAASVPRLGEIELNLAVLTFTLVVSLASGVLFGSLPALRLSRMPLFATVKDGTRRTSSGGRALVAAEIALSIVLLIAASLLIRSFVQLQSIPPGFNSASTLTMELTMSGQKYAAAPAVFETYRRLWERLEQLPGVEAAGGVSALPLSQMMSWGPITVEGRALVPGEAFINVDQRMVGGDYFAALQIPLVAGRLFGEHDTRESLRVSLVDEHMARRLWPGEGAVGKRVRIGGADSTAPWLTIVGVVGRVKQDALDAESRMAMYFPHAQVTTRAMNVVVRSAREPAQLTSAVREAVRAIDPDLPMYGVRTMEDRVSASLAPRRFAVLLLTLFAGVAMGLAVIGVYSVLAYVVNHERRALGIRLALGATPRAVRLFILKQGLVVTAIGTVVGLAIAVLASRLLEGLLFGVAALDPLTFVIVPVLLTLAALVAAYVPARRASRVDPVTSLRAE